MNRFSAGLNVATPTTVPFVAPVRRVSRVTDDSAKGTLVDKTLVIRVNCYDYWTKGNLPNDHLP